MHYPLRRSVLTVAAFVTASALAAQAAQAAAPQWRIKLTDTAKTVGSDVNTIDDVAAVGVKDVWAVGKVERAGGAFTHGFAQHWNGKKWVVTPLPSEFRRTSSDRWRNDLNLVAASGSKNAWAFGSSYAGSKTQRYQYALHWDGKRWKVSHRWKTYGWFSDAVAFSSKNVWLFGERGGGDSPLGDWHYDGRTWTRVTPPGFSVLKVGAVSSKDMWAIVGKPSGQGRDATQVAHYDGRAWKLAPTPKIVGAYGEGPEFKAIAARSSREVLVAGMLRTQVNGVEKENPLVLRWNGKTWQRFNGPSDRGEARSVIADGKGGFWTSLGSSYGGRVYHVTGGKWVQTPLPKVKGKYVGARDLFTIPGSPSLWATGLLYWGGYPSSNGLILKYSR